jgi:hypothetical protein
MGQSLIKAIQSTIKFVSFIGKALIFSQNALFLLTSHVFVAARQGSHKWNLSTGPWRSADGVTVDSYHISSAMWSQSGSNIGRIGVIVHELGHFMGASDMFDTDGGKYESSPIHFLTCFKDNQLTNFFRTL